MNKVKKLITFVTAALMIFSFVPASNTYAANISNLAANTLSTDYSVTITQRNASRTSAYISWDDPDYVNSSYTIVATAMESTSPSYGPGDTKTFNVSNTDNTNLTGLLSGMPYKVVLYKKDNKTGSTKIIAENKVITKANFLVLVGESLYKNSGFRSTLNNYVKNLRYYEGIGAEVVRISKTEQSTNVKKCTTPQQVKSIIQQKYGNGTGAEGFVIIGSETDIPSAFYKKEAKETEASPTDLYFADLNGAWSDTDDDGFFDQCGDKHPEMYFGRIDTKGTGAYYGKSEVELTKSYLDRVNRYREYGGNLDTVSSKRALLFEDASNNRTNKTNAYNIESVIPNIVGVYDEDETSRANWLKEINEGYALIHLSSHSGNDANTFYKLNGQVETVTPSNILNNATIVPKFNFMEMDACTACRYVTDDRIPCVNMGGAYLFKENSYGLNVTGGTKEMYSDNIDKKFYNDLADKVSVGKAFKDAIIRQKSGIESQLYVLLGDPTIHYNLNKPSKNVPIITNDFAGKKDDYISINAEENHIFRAGDRNEQLFVDLKINGVPDNYLFMKDNSVVWRPELKKLGKNSFEIKSYNKDANGNIIRSYTEKFTAYIVKNTSEYFNPNEYLAAKYWNDFNGAYGYANGRYSILFKSPSVSDYITFNTVYAETEGDYKVKINYYDEKGRTATVKNTSYPNTVRNVTFDSSNTPKVVTLHLKQGFNSINIKATSNLGLPSMYSIEISK